MRFLYVFPSIASIIWMSLLRTSITGETVMNPITIAMIEEF
jgi:hypothetical protein